jgi:hypothetical protein
MTRGVRPGDSDVSAAIDHDPVGLVLDRLHGAGCNPKQASSGQWNAKCPVSANHAHGDKNPSLSVGTGPDGKALVCCHKGCRLPDIAHALDIGVHDMFPPRPRATIGDGKRITAEYPYYSADGELIFEVLRYSPKTFRQRRPDGNGGWTWSLGGLHERPLYQLPQLRAAIASRFTMPNTSKPIDGNTTTSDAWCLTARRHRTL